MNSPRKRGPKRRVKDALKISHLNYWSGKIKMLLFSLRIRRTNSLIRLYMQPQSRPLPFPQQPWFRWKQSLALSTKLPFLPQKEWHSSSISSWPWSAQEGRNIKLIKGNQNRHGWRRCGKLASVLLESISRQFIKAFNDVISPDFLMLRQQTFES